MRERDVERRLVNAVRDLGGYAAKFISPGLDGVPDRLILLPGGRMAFVEVKAPGEELRPVQRARIRQFERLGFRVYVVDHPERIGGVLDEICAP